MAKIQVFVELLIGFVFGISGNEVADRITIDFELIVVVDENNPIILEMLGNYIPIDFGT